MSAIQKEVEMLETLRNMLVYIAVAWILSLNHSSWVLWLIFWACAVWGIVEWFYYAFKNQREQEEKENEK